MQNFSFSDLLNRYTYVNGELALPCVPALLETYIDRLEQMFISLGKPFSKDDLAKLREMLSSYLNQGFRATSTTYLILKYNPSKSPDTGISYTVSYATNSSIKPTHNNHEIEISIPAMFGVQASSKISGTPKLLERSTKLKILKIGVPPENQSSLCIPNFLKVVNRHTQVKGEIVMPCMPSLLSCYMAKLEKLFISVSKAFSKNDLLVLHKLLKENLINGFQHSPLSKVVIQYESAISPNIGVSYKVAYSLTSIAEQYQNWVDTRTPPLFGKNPDSKLMNILKDMGTPSDLKVLDIGAGTGRNTLPLAKLGYKVEALELAPALVKQLKIDAQAQDVNVIVLEGDVLDPLMSLSADTYNLIVCAEVVASHFRNVKQIKVLLKKVSESLCQGGLFLFNLFIAHEDYQPTQVAREFSEVVWSSMFTNQDLKTAFEQLPLEIISNESVFDYEHTHLQPNYWPPTGWFESWSKGKDLFGFEESQMELRWVLCKHIGSSTPFPPKK